MPAVSTPNHVSGDGLWKRSQRDEWGRRITSSCFLAVTVISFLNASAIAGPLTIHPRGESLPANQQGPFVTTTDGGILCIDAKEAHRSLDEGKTWTSTPLFRNPQQFQVSDERALLRTKEGTVISAWMNSRELSYPKGPKGWLWGGTPDEYSQWILPTYVCRSFDDGVTWEEPILLQREWCGCIHSMIQTRSGRIVLVGQTIIPEWRHTTVMYVSDDQGKSWQKSNMLDYGVGQHDHAGSCEATILERQDGSLFLLLRTESGFFFEAESQDGLQWINLKKSSIPSVTCCGNLYRLADGRAALLWNHPLRSDPTDGHSRYELSIALSEDDGKTWGDRTVVATRFRHAGDGFATTRVSYPYLYERHPGELWITTMQGGVRLKIHQKDLQSDSIPLPQSVVILGDSTAAYRPGEVKQVASDRIDRELNAAGKDILVLNRGVPGNTTRDGLDRLRKFLPSAQPRLVVVQFGINDAAVDVWKSPPASTSRVSLAEFESNLRQIAALAQSQGAAVIFATTNPVRWTDKLKGLYGKAPYQPDEVEGFDRPILSGYNEAIRKLAAELQVPLVDLHTVYLTHAREKGIPVDELLLDGIHPNDAGQELAAAALLPAIRQALNNSTPAQR